jgi:HAD superfamily hydrolase (TIGR01509 family)
LDGTLYASPEYGKRLEEEVVRVVSGELSLDPVHASILLNRKRKKIGTITRAVESLGIDRKCFYKKIAGRIDPCLYISPNPKVRHTIKKLKRSGFRIGLVSNSGRELVGKVLDAIGVEPTLFDTIVTSTEAQPKPSPQPFLLAIKSLRCERDDTVYVGDREEPELRPARELGLKTILVSVRKRHSRWADIVVTNITELPRVLIRDKKDC